MKWLLLLLIMIDDNEIRCVLGNAQYRSQRINGYTVEIGSMIWATRGGEAALAFDYD